MNHDPSRLTAKTLLAAVLVSACASLHAGPVTDNQLRMRLEDHQQPGFVDAVKASRPIAYFQLNAASGDSPGGTSKYTMAGGAKVGKPGAPIHIGNTHCLHLDGTTGHVTTTQAGGIDAQASLMAFVHLDALPSAAGHAFFVVGETNDDQGVDLTFDTEDALQFRTGTGAPLAYKPAELKLAHAWHWIIATIDARTRERVIYWDGEAVAHDSLGDTPRTTAPLAIGAPVTANGQFFAGCMAEVALWNRALPASEIDQLDAARKR